MAMVKKKVATKWDDVHKQAILEGFKEYGWDPKETEGKTINSTIKSVLDLFETLQPSFSKTGGGEKQNNMRIYDHYKKLGCEYIVVRTRAGVRRNTETDDGAFLFDCRHWILDLHSFIVLSPLLQLTTL